MANMANANVHGNCLSKNRDFPMYIYIYNVYIMYIYNIYIIYNAQLYHI